MYPVNEESQTVHQIGKLGVGKSGGSNLHVKSHSLHRLCMMRLVSGDKEMVEAGDESLFDI